MLFVIKTISGRLTAGLVLLLLLLTVERGRSQGPEELETLYQQSEELDTSIKARQSEVENYQEEEVSVLDGLQLLEVELNGTVQQTTVLTSELEEIDRQIEKIDRSARDLAARINETEAYVVQRLLAIYKLNRIGRVQVLASANTVFELLRRKNAIEQILLNDEVMLKKHLADKKHLASLSENLNQKRREKIELENALQRQVDILERKRAERQVVLEGVRSKKALVIASLEALTAAARDLDQTILQLQKEAEKLAEVRGKPFDTCRGLLDLPVSGDVVAFFGPYKNQRFNVTNFRSGIEIGADRGEPVRAVLGGRVLYAGWFKNYGNMIIVDHGDHYYTLYAHAEELFKSKGDYVETHEVIATVGDSASMTGTNLYFEVRHHGKPMDPMAWLKTG